MIATARDLARRHPRAKLACPICATSLAAENLDKHLAKVHPGALDVAAPWRGKDYRIVLTALLLIPIAIAAGVAIVFAADVSNDLNQFRIVAGAGGSFLVLALVGMTGWFPGWLRLDGDRVRYKHSLGLGRRTVAMPCTITIGPLVTTHRIDAANDFNSPGTEVRVGFYLRVTSGRTSITIGCRHNTLATMHWTGWQQGSKRNFCDVIIPGPEMVALEYALAQRGLLAALIP